MLCSLLFRMPGREFETAGGALLASLIRHNGLVNFTSGSIVAGGVTLDLSPLLASDKRESDKGSDLGKSRTRPAGDWKQTKGE